MLENSVVLIQLIMLKSFFNFIVQVRLMVHWQLKSHSFNLRLILHQQLLSVGRVIMLKSLELLILRALRCKSQLVQVIGDSG